jgi:hypothetical protein
MWRYQSVHERSEAEYLDQAIERIEADKLLREHTDALLHGASEQEPMIAQLLDTPQDIRYHAEGPKVKDHLRLMLTALYALAEEKLHLIDIEEFRRLKGYEGEIDEVEEIIKENIGLFEVFTLLHDAAKYSTITFSAPDGSRGADLGFNSPQSHHFDEAAHERAALRLQYQNLFNEFSAKHPTASDREIQVQFSLAYGIQVHYPHHGRKIHAPMYEDLLDRFCDAHKLPSRDRDLLDDLISHHMEFNKDFGRDKPGSMGRYVHLAKKRGYDADDFIDLMQGCLLLDMVIGSKRLAPHGYWHDSTPLENCLRSEHDWAPHRRMEKAKINESKESRERNKAFQKVGLDGIALMDLLKMEAGKEFGITLRRIHAAVLGKGEMPRFGKKIDKEINVRAGEFYKQVFEKGE